MITAIILTAGIVLMSALMIPIFIVIHMAYKDEVKKKKQKESEKKRGY